MATRNPIKVVLMSTDLRPADGRGFHRMVYRLEAGGRSIGIVTVQISHDAFAKLTGQMARAGNVRLDGVTLLTTWARWAILERIEAGHSLQPLLTITSGDVDDFGGYATELGRSLKVG